MSLPTLKQSGNTLEDWKSWEGRWELINGVAYDMTPAPTILHQDLVGSLYLQIRGTLDRDKPRGGGCRVFLAPVDVYLPPETVVEPDLLVVCDPAKIHPHGIVGAPDLVVEILSPSTASKDLTRKWWLYEGAGVQEYLIVDPMEKVNRLLCLVAGRYVETARVEWGGTVTLLGGELTVVVGAEK